jgi:hypothetical protein
MSAIDARVRRLEAVAAPLDAIRILIPPTEPDSAPQMLSDGMRSATAAEIAGDGAGCVVWLDAADLSL